MSGVTGGDFLRLLHSFVVTNEQDLLKGVIKFTVNPSCLCYLNERYSFELKREVDSFERRILFDIVSVMKRVPYVKIEANNLPNVESPPINIELFENMKNFELDVSQPSSIIGLDKIYKQIQKISFHGGLGAVSDILVGWISPDQNPGTLTPQIWPKLIWLDCSNNGLTSLDKSLKYLPALQYINLSQNNLTTVPYLDDCYQLSHLDMSYNQMSSLSQIFLLLGCITHFNLCSNGISSTLGLEKMLGLVKLDLSYNLISNVVEVERLRDLPFLVHLILEGNPISNSPNYRASIFRIFVLKRNFILDDSPALETETTDLLSITPRNRTKQSQSKKRIVDIHDLNVESTAKDDGGFSHSTQALGLASRLEQMRKEGGNSWLLIYNQMNEPTGLGTLPSTKNQSQSFANHSKPSVGSELPSSGINHASKPTDEKGAVLPVPVKNDAGFSRKYIVRGIRNIQIIVEISKVNILEISMDDGTILKTRLVKHIINSYEDPNNHKVYTIEFVAPEQGPTGSGKMKVETVKYEFEQEYMIADMQKTIQSLLSNGDLSTIATQVIDASQTKSKPIEIPSKHSPTTVSHPPSSTSSNHGQSLDGGHQQQTLMSTPPLSELFSPKLGQRTLGDVATSSKDTYSNVRKPAQSLDSLSALSPRGKARSEFSREMDGNGETGRVGKDDSGIHTRSMSPPLQLDFPVPTSPRSSRPPIGDKIDPKVHTFFRSQILKGRVEKIVCYLECSYLKYGSKISEERLAHAFWMESSLYIIKEKKGASGYELGVHIQSNQIKRLGIGSWCQLIRVEMGSVAHILLVRDKAKTEKVLDFINRSWMTPTGSPPKFDVYFYEAETQSVIGELVEDLEGDDAVANYYLMAYLVIDKEDDSTCPCRHESRPVTPRSIVVTEERIFILHDDYLRWPLLPSAPIPTTSEFKCDKQAKILEVTKLELIGDCGCLMFMESEENDAEFTWHIVTSSPASRESLVHAIASKWKHIFKVEMEITQR